jgi:glutathione synthase/RimK-type ligase-like ATP-grasp enzyme
MKEAFTENNIKTADWWIASKENNEIIFINKYSEKDKIFKIDELSYPIVCKYIYGSRGTGNTLIKSKEELESWLNNKNLSKYIFEKFYSYSREYRIHVTKDGYFYTCRKMLKNDTPENQRWRRHDDNSVWILENNEKFDKPVNWNDIVNESIKTLNSVGLDIGAIDLKVQSKLDKLGNIRENPKFIILETNSAPSFGQITSQKYLIEINKLLLNKKQNG